MATDNNERYLKQIADELHQMNRVLERMAQAPIFYNEDQMIEFSKRLSEESVVYMSDYISDPQ